MILLDPELEPDPAPASAARATGSVRFSPRIPSRRTLAAFLRAAQAAAHVRGRVQVLLTTDRAIRRLNREFRGIDKATDVLSFPAAEQFSGIAGDVAISVQTARRQAAEQDHSLAVEIKVLMLHGLLHLAGYDHETDDGLMARRERVLLGKLGLPLGLIERSAAEAKAPRKLAAQMYGLKPVLLSDESFSGEVSQGIPFRGESSGGRVPRGSGRNAMAVRRSGKA